MGYFTTETICLECKLDERACPHFAEAQAAEEAAVRTGDFNFPGIGLGADDRAVLHQRLATRRASIPTTTTTETKETDQ